MKKVDETYTNESVDKRVNSRRTFLKKAAYTAPIVLTLGQLVKPTKVHADSGPPDGPPGGFGGF